MSASVQTVPFELRAIRIDEVAQLIGLAPRTVLETLAPRPDFPVRVSMRPASWVAGEIIAWRDEQRQAGPRHRKPVQS